MTGAGDLAEGTVHRMGDDVRDAIGGDPQLAARWNALTPLGRNEYLCWIDDAKRPVTRERRIARTAGEVADGKKRPCCWPGCIHRTDKAPGAWQQAVLINGKPR